MLSCSPFRERPWKSQKPAERGFWVPCCFSLSPVELSHRADHRARWWDHAPQSLPADILAAQQAQWVRIRARKRSVIIKRPAYLYIRSGEHTYELQSLIPISYAVFCFK